MSTSTLLSPRELAISTGWPERRIRNLLSNQSLKHIKIGSNYFLPPYAIEEFIEREMFDPCQDNTQDQDSSKKTRTNPKTGKPQRSKFWYIYFKDPRSGNFRELCTFETTTEQAEDFKQEKLKEIFAGIRGNSPPAKHVSILDVLDEYWTFKKDTRSADRLRYSLVHLVDFWGGRSVSYVNIETIKHYCSQSVRAKSTLKRELHDLRSAVNHAITMERLAPYEFPKIPIKEQPRQISMSRNEVAKLLRSARSEFRSSFQLTLFIIIGYYSGARKAAILGLKWEQINFDQNTIDFRDPELEETKKKRSFIPMPPKLREFLLRRFRRYSNQSQFVFHYKTKIGKQVKSIDKGFRAAADRAKLEGVTPHTLRHTRVTELVQAGHSVRTIMAYMALTHETIFKVYAHVNEKDVLNLAASIGRSPNVRETREMT